MTKTGPQRYPGASTAHWWQSTWGGDAMEVNVIALHTTEGTALDSYQNGAVAPNFTAAPDFKAKRLNWFQHFDFDVSSRALQNLAGGVETNTLNVSQVELIGTCDEAKATSWGKLRAGVDYVFWPDPPQWALQDLAVLLRWAHTNHGVPLSGPSMWLAYGKDSRRPGVTPASYGASPARMSFAQWTGFKGICGHQHVPENVHGDPGALPFSKLLALASGAPVTPPEDDMPEPFDVWAYKGKGETHDAYAYLRGTNADVKTLGKKLDALTATTNTLAKAVAANNPNIDGPTLIAEIKQAIADAVVDVDVTVHDATS